MSERIAIGALRGAGWLPGRRVEIGADLASFREEQCGTFDRALEFLREYSGLTIIFDRDGEPDELWFSGARACDLIFPEWIDDYSRRTGMALVPVGATNGEYLVILIGEDGSFYGGFDDVFGSLGASLLEMIENVIQDKDFVERFDK